MSAVLASAPRIPTPWRTALALLVAVLCLILFTYRGTAVAMVAIWLRSDTFAHAMLVVPISLWLIWRRRAELQPLQPRPAPLWLLPMSAAALLWLAGELVSVNAATQLAMTALVVFAVPVLVGADVARRILFPLAFVFFAVPIGEFLMPKMIVWTADFTVLALRLSGIPVFREGEQLIIPSGHWAVVEACSGIRYLIASVVVGALFAYLNYRSTKRRVLFMAVAVLVPVVANWVRAYLIVLTGHLSGNQLAVGVDHIIYGWVFFGVVVAIMFAIGMRWAEPEAVPGEASGEAGQHAAASVGRTVWWPAVAVAVLIVVAPSIALQAVRASSSTAPPSVARLAAPPAGWSVADDFVPGWTPAFSGFRASLRAQHSDASGRRAGLWLGVWREQDFESKMVSSMNAVSRSGDPWVRVASGTRVVPVPDGRELAVRTALLRAGAPGSNARVLVWQIYWVEGTWTASDVRAKLWGAWHHVRGRGDDAATLLVFAPAAEGDDPERTLADYLRAQWPRISAELAALDDAQGERR